MSVLIVDTGVANLAAVRAALARLGVAARSTTDAREVAGAERVILPGVGSFARGMAALRAHGLDEAVRARIARGAPTLCICLGMQLLTTGSEEAPEVAGLGIVPGVCKRLPCAPSLPHLGWDVVMRASPSGALGTGWAAFAHSYALVDVPSGFEVCVARHGVSFVAALARGALVACQFHPELSGAYGSELIAAWLEQRAMHDQRAVVRSSAGTRRVIPCLDIRGGRVVKGVQFEDLEDAGDPAARAALYAQQGADEIAMLDVAATAEQRVAALEQVRSVRAAVDVPLLVGGGVRDLQHARALLVAGADKMSVNTAAVRDPDLVNVLACELGSQSTVLAVDAKRTDDGWEVRTMGGRVADGRDVVGWCREGEARGAGEILLTSVDRDGTQRGCDLDLLRAVASAVTVPVIASGGIGSVEHAADALESGARAVLAASIFHRDRITVADFKRELGERGIEVRP
jgi:imidazole glycerol phosphate synthase glutamine amidotransferase subunit